MNGIAPGELLQISQNSRKMAILRQIYGPFLTTSLRQRGLKNDQAQIESLINCPLGQISVPAWIAHSQSDPLASYEDAYQTSTRIPGPEMPTVPGGGHVFFIAYEEEVGPKLHDFLTSNQPSSCKRCPKDKPYYYVNIYLLLRDINS